MPSGLRPECRACRAASRRKWCKQNPEIRRAANKRFHEKHKARVTERAKKWYNANREHALAYRRAYYQKNKQRRNAYVKARRVADQKFRMRCNLSAQFSGLIGAKPVGGFQAIVGYSLDDLRAHLERQFTKSMSWENYGEVWEIDHVVPVDSFDLPREVAVCWALTNLRPLTKKQNRRKSFLRTHLI
jgi:hypothetical protein